MNLSLAFASTGAVRRDQCWPGQPAGSRLVS